MRKKGPVLANVDELLYAIRSCMNEEASMRASSAEGASAQVPSLLRFHHGHESAAPSSLHVTQFYLKRYGAPDAETLEALPTDMFILC